MALEDNVWIAKLDLTPLRDLNQEPSHCEATMLRR